MGFEAMQRAEKFSIERGELRLAGGVIETVDIRPERLSVERPVLIAPGWNETPETFEDSLEVIAENERRVLTVAHARHGIDVSQLSPELRGEFPEVELRKALALIALLTEKNLEGVDAIGHSEGGYNVLIAAKIAPHLFRNIVLETPAGIMGKDSFWSLFGRFSGAHMEMGVKTTFGWRPERDPGGFRAQKETVKEFLKNPVRALKEAAAISHADTIQLIQELRRDGITIAVMANVDDPVFPMARIQETVKRGELDGFLSLKGEHYDINTDAEHHTKIALRLLQSLEKKRTGNPSES